MCKTLDVYVLRTAQLKTSFFIRGIELTEVFLTNFAASLFSELANVFCTLLVVLSCSVPLCYTGDRTID